MSSGTRPPRCAHLDLALSAVGIACAAARVSADSFSVQMYRIRQAYEAEYTRAMRGNISTRWCKLSLQLWYWDPELTLTVIEPRIASRKQQLPWRDIIKYVADAAVVAPAAVQLSIETFAQPSTRDDLVFASGGLYFAIDLHTARLLILDRASYDSLVRTEGGEKGFRAGSSMTGEPFTARTADGRSDSHGALFFPREFDPRKGPYPVVEILYGDTFMAIAPREFFWHDHFGTMQRLLNDAGYIVATVDSPGTPGLSKAYNDAEYGIFPQGLIANHVSALRQLAAQRPYMDLKRVGVFGISSSGMMVERALIDAPDFYKVAIAVNPAGDPESYPSSWYELDLGLPSVNPGGYQAAAILPHVDRITANLLIVGSALDTDAGLPSSLKMLNAMIEAGKDVDFALLPLANHDMSSSGENTYWWFNTDCLRYFLRHLPTAVP